MNTASRKILVVDDEAIPRITPLVTAALTQVYSDRLFVQCC